MGTEGDPREEQEEVVSFHHLLIMEFCAGKYISTLTEVVSANSFLIQQALFDFFVGGIWLASCFELRESSQEVRLQIDVSPQAAVEVNEWVYLSYPVA